MPAPHRTLVEGASRGDPPSIDALLEKHLPRLRAFVRLRMPQAIRERESASDLVQSVCREALEDLDSGFDYRGEAAFRSWLFTAALHKFQDRIRYYRAQKRDVAREQTESIVDCGQLAHAFPTPSRVALGREQLEKLEQAFDQLPDDYREVITLSRVVGLSHAEIGEQIGRSENATRVLLQRALARLSWIMSRSLLED